MRYWPPTMPEPVSSKGYELWVTLVRLRGTRRLAFYREGKEGEGYRESTHDVRLGERTVYYSSIPTFNKLVDKRHQRMHS